MPYSFYRFICRYLYFILFTTITPLAYSGCLPVINMTKQEKPHLQLKPGTIIAAPNAESISFEKLIESLSDTPVIYIGEQHLNPEHHKIQLNILKALHQKDPNITVGMEMIDESYQSICTQWSKGALLKETFIHQLHWYANWRYDFALYNDLFTYIKDERLNLIALNVPFHIPPKVAVGGLHNLLPEEKAYLPQHIDLNDVDHKAYLKEIFELHPRRKGRENFDYFYEAQCLWEDAMAEKIATRGEKKKIVVIIGNGHIQKKYGVPNRAFKKYSEPFKTIILQSDTEKLDITMGDFIYITEKISMPHPMKKK